MEHCEERPNRSDIHLGVEEEARIEAETRDHFEGLAPKRHSKPQRSDHSSAYLDANTDDSRVIPEDAEFQRLEGHEEKLVYSSGQAAEEFVETDYYNDLNRVDKQHHTEQASSKKRVSRLIRSIMITWRKKKKKKRIATEPVVVMDLAMVTQPPMNGYQLLQKRFCFRQTKQE